MKKLFAFCLILTILLSFSACKKNPPSDGYLSSGDFISSDIPEVSEEITSQQQSDADTPSGTTDATVTEQKAKGNTNKPSGGKSNTKPQETYVAPQNPATPQQGKTNNYIIPNTTEVVVDPDIPPEANATANYKGFSYTTGQKHTPFGENGRFFYSRLSSADKEIYNKIGAAVKNFETEVFIGEELTDSGKYKIYYMYMFDHPEAFYLCNQLGVFYTADPETHEADVNSQGLIISYSYASKTSSGGKELDNAFLNALKSKIAKFNSAVDAITATIPADAGPAVKEKMIYDYILRNCSYNTSAVWDNYAEDNWSAYGGIINKTGTCEAYSEAFQLLCYKVGINCTILSFEADTARHKWNAVQLDGEWYACDLTYDDPVGNDPNSVNHVYFNRTSSELVGIGHPPVQSEFPSPSCTGTKYSFENYFK